MKIFVFSLLGIFVGVVLGSDKRIVCYFSPLSLGYKRPYNFGPRDIPTQLCTDVVFDFVTFSNDTFEMENPYGWDVLHQFTALGSSSINLFVRVGGEGESTKWSAMASDASKRSSFVASTLRLVRERGFNGLDLNWKFPKAADRDNFVKLVEELEDVFKPLGLLLTSSVYMGEIVLDMNSGYDIQRLSELLDWMNVVTTNLRGPWNDFVDVPSPLYRRPFDVAEFKYLNVHDGMEILGSLGAPRHKLVVGVAFVGKSYTLRSPSATYPAAPINASVRQGDPGPVTDSKWFLAYYEICRMVSIGKWTRRFDHVGKCPYAFHGDQWVGYDDEQSIRIKMEYVRNRGYGGANVLSVNFDDFNGFCGSKNPLLHALHDSLSEKKDEQQTVDSSESMLRKRYEAMGIVPTCKVYFR